MTQPKLTASHEILLTIAAINSATASSMTLIFAQLFGQKKAIESKRGRFVVAKYCSQYYMLDYEPAALDAAEEPG